MAESRFLWMSAFAWARRDAVSSPGGRLAACFRSMSSAAKRRPSFCFSASALRCACNCAWRSRSASALRRASSSSRRRRSASARSCAFCSSSILREKASRPARMSGAGAPGTDGDAGAGVMPSRAAVPGAPRPARFCGLLQLAKPGRALAVRCNRLFEVFVFFAGHEADLPQGGELLLRFLHVVRQEVSLAQVFARAAMARVELERAPVVFERGIELPGIAVGVSEEILDVGVAIVLQERLVQALDGALPVLRFDRLLSCGIVRAGGRSLLVLLARVGLRSRDRDEDACENQRGECARHAAHCRRGALSAAQAGTPLPRAARLDRCRRSLRARRASRNTRAPCPGRRPPAPPWPRRRSRAAGFARRARRPRTPAVQRRAGRARGAGRRT